MEARLEEAMLTEEVAVARRRLAEFERDRALADADAANTRATAAQAQADSVVLDAHDNVAGGRAETALASARFLRARFGAHTFSARAVLCARISAHSKFDKTCTQKRTRRKLANAFCARFRARAFTARAFLHARVCAHIHLQAHVPVGIFARACFLRLRFPASVMFCAFTILRGRFMPADRNARAKTRTQETGTCFLRTRFCARAKKTSHKTCACK